MDIKKALARCVPKVGMRNIKTAIAAALCAVVYYAWGRSPAFACIGAIFGMGSDLSDSKLNGGNRLFGTVIGGLLGIALFRIYLIFYPDGRHSLLLVPLIFLGTVILIVLCQIFWVGGVQPGGVVYRSGFGRTYSGFGVDEQFRRGGRDSEDSCEGYFHDFR